MYAETGHQLRTELTALLDQHRVQQRLGGPARHRPSPSSPQQREEYGELIRRYRQSALVWCQEAALAIAPTALSAITPSITNPFTRRPAGMSRSTC